MCSHGSGYHDRSQAHSDTSTYADRRLLLRPDSSVSTTVSLPAIEATSSTHTGVVLIRVEGHDLPGRSCGPSPERPTGHHGIEVGVQRKNRPGELMGQVSAEVESVTWELEATPSSSDHFDFRGPHISGPPGGRFIYLSWGVVQKPGSFEMFRRAKIMFDGIPAEVLATVQASGVLIGRLGLTDPKGNPICAAVRPPLIEWMSAFE
jgi:hypothetical protein